jgi:nucleotide-binding universal stress UspA family protein
MITVPVVTRPVPSPVPGAGLHRILCAIDFSAASAEAVGEAVALARASRGEITILFVLPFPKPSRDDVPPVPDGVISAVAGDVEALVQPARAVGIPVRVCLKAGDPAREILETIARTSPDVVVMGAHARGGLKRRALGSVASAVLREARCPVLTVASRVSTGRPAPPAAPHRDSVVCAVGLSPTSSRTFDFACAAARASGARLTLVHVLGDHDPREERQAAAQLHAVGTLAAAYGLAGERVEEAVVAGNPAGEIVRLADARSAGMIVIGGGADGPRPGSLPDKVVRAARCAVVTVCRPS